MDKKIIEIVAKITNKDEAYLVSHTEEQGLWDSLKLVEMIFALEDEFDIMFEESEIAEMKTINKIFLYVSRKVEE